MSYAYATNEEEKGIEEVSETSSETLDITEIKEKLNSYYESNNYNEYLNYLNSLSINDLPENFLKYELERLYALSIITMEEAFKFSFKDKLKGFFIPFALLSMSIFNFFNNYNKVLLTIINGYLIVDFSYRIGSIVSGYFKEKKSLMLEY